MWCSPRPRGCEQNRFGPPQFENTSFHWQPSLPKPRPSPTPRPPIKNVPSPKTSKFNLKLHANGRNIVGCYILCPFAHPVACFWMFLSKVWNRTHLAPSKRTQHCWNVCTYSSLKIGVTVLNLKLLFVSLNNYLFSFLRRDFFSSVLLNNIKVNTKR